MARTRVLRNRQGDIASAHYVRLCPICRSPGESPVDALQDMIRCPQCGLVYKPYSPVLSSLVEHYVHVDPHRSVACSKHRLYEHILRKLEGLLGGKGYLLDVGSNYGYFLKITRDRGWKVQGVEIVHEACSFCRTHYGIDVFEGELKDAKFPSGYFDVVTLWEVLAEVPDPLEELLEVRRVLKEDGLLFVRERNVVFQIFLRSLYKGRGSGLWKKLSIGDPFVFHPHNFSAACFEELLSRAGFGQVRIRNSRLTSGDPYSSFRSEGIASKMKSVVYMLCQLTYFGSFGKLLWGPSLEAWAVKN